MNINLLNTSNLIWICIVLHLISDFFLQVCLANLKQKKWMERFVDDHRKYYNRGESEVSA